MSSGRAKKVTSSKNAAKSCTSLKSPVMGTSIAITGLMEIYPTNGNFNAPKGQNFSPTAESLGLNGRKIYPRVGNAGLQKYESGLDEWKRG
jgi:hypothetical protein